MAFHEIIYSISQSLLRVRVDAIALSCIFLDIYLLQNFFLLPFLLALLFPIDIEKHTLFF